MKLPFLRILALCTLPLLVAGTGRGTELRSKQLVLRHNPATGDVTLSRTGKEKPTLRFSVPAAAMATTKDGALNLALRELKLRRDDGPLLILDKLWKL